MPERDRAPSSNYASPPNTKLPLNPAQLEAKSFRAGADLAAVQSASATRVAELIARAHHPIELVTNASAFHHLRRGFADAPAERLVSIDRSRSCLDRPCQSDLRDSRWGDHPGNIDARVVALRESASRQRPETEPRAFALPCLDEKFTLASPWSSATKEYRASPATSPRRELRLRLTATTTSLPECARGSSYSL